MTVDGVGGKQHTDIKMHDMKSLGIQENSKEASIFNEIDESDGVKDGKLSDFQLFKYNVRTTLEEERKKQEEILKKVDEEIALKTKLVNARLDIKRKFSDAEFNFEKNTVTIESLNIYDFEISTLEQIEELEVRIDQEKIKKETYHMHNEAIKNSEVQFGY